MLIMLPFSVRFLFAYKKLSMRLSWSSRFAGFNFAIMWRQVFEFVGQSRIGSGCRLRHRQRRTWRLRLVLQCLLRRGGAAPAQVRVVLEHFVNHLLLCRPALSILDDLYRLSGESLEYAKFSLAVLAELKVASVLVLLCEVTMAPRS